MEHLYIDRCNLLTPLEPFNLVFASVYFLASVLWIVYTWYIWKNQNYTLQKWLVFISITKTLWLL